MYPVVNVVDSMFKTYPEAAWRGRMLRRKLRCSSSASRHFLACFDCREGRPGVIMQTKRVQYPINSNHVSLLWQSSLLFVSGLAISLHLLNSGIVEVRFDQMELVLPCGSRTIRDDINMQLTQASVKKKPWRVCNPPYTSRFVRVIPAQGPC